MKTNIHFLSYLAQFLGRSQMTIWRMSIACRILKGTRKHSKYVVVTAFPLQHWLQ